MQLMTYFSILLNKPLLHIHEVKQNHNYVNFSSTKEKDYDSVTLQKRLDVIANCFSTLTITTILYSYLG